MHIIYIFSLLFCTSLPLQLFTSSTLYLSNSLPLQLFTSLPLYLLTSFLYLFTNSTLIFCSSFCTLLPFQLFFCASFYTSLPLQLFFSLPLSVPLQLLFSVFIYLVNSSIFLYSLSVLYNLFSLYL